MAPTQWTSNCIIFGHFLTMNLEEQLNESQELWKPCLFWDSPAMWLSLALNSWFSCLRLHCWEYRHMLPFLRRSSLPGIAGLLRSLTGDWGLTTCNPCGPTPSNAQHLNMDDAQLVPSPTSSISPCGQMFTRASFVDGCKPKEPYHGLGSPNPSEGQGAGGKQRLVSFCPFSGTRGRRFLLDPYCNSH
jgi:hypothetical protein